MSHSDTHSNSNSNNHHHAHSHSALIWRVFAFLSLVTVVEVILGILKPHALHLTNFLGTSLLNWIFLILTLVKAYGIAWYFMHLKDEKTWLRRAIVWTTVFLILYLSFFLLYEGGALGEIAHSLTKWQ
ncbi:MAG: cytochrome C oxidase subunit IV family protein [Flavobacteriaceae bacterium]|nr:cytochrome C oxidase subunit IV family protein [Flavobacteriaceae bacterium]